MDVSTRAFVTELRFVINCLGAVHCNARFQALPIALVAVALITTAPHTVANAQAPNHPLRDRIRNRLQERAASSQRASAASPNQQQQRAFSTASRAQSQSVLRTGIGGVAVAYWPPPTKVAIPPRAPLIVFSHGFNGTDAQSSFLMQALADAGYFVVSPKHSDALGSGVHKPAVPFGKPDQWTDETCKDRADDIAAVIRGLKTDPRFKSRIDFERVGIAGHSLGGYTALGVAGGWPNWKLDVPVKAVLGLSPFAAPFLRHGTLEKMTIPVMYQGGSRDVGITPTIRRPGGAFEKTHGDVWFVDFDNFNHYSWTNLNRDESQKQAISAWSIWFFNRYLRGINAPQPQSGAALHHYSTEPASSLPTHSQSHVQTPAPISDSAP